MKLILVKSFWGMEGPLRDKVRMIAETGYDACEGRPAGIGTFDEFMPLLREFKLAYVPMILTEGAGDSVAAHLADFRTKLEEALRFEPLQITAHSGRDCWSFAEQEEFFGTALELERSCGIPINHETHRSRAMFTPWTTAALLRHFPDLHIVADFSHWVNVCERLPEDQADNLALAISRARHVHGRVGHEQGPQVNDPRAPEWTSHLAAHEAWWDAIIQTRQQAGAAHFTFNPEFGPPTYMPTLPHTQQPVVNLWEVCLWMAQRFKQRYSTLIA